MASGERSQLQAGSRSLPQSRALDGWAGAGDGREESAVGPLRFAPSFRAR